MSIYSYLVIGILISGCNYNQLFAPTYPAFPTMTPLITFLSTSTKTPMYTRTETLTLTNTNKSSSTYIPSLTETVTLKINPSLSASNSNRFYDTDGTTKFSYIPPIGWKEINSSTGILNMWYFERQHDPQVKVYECGLYFMVRYYGNKSLENIVKSEYGNEVIPGIKIDSKGKFYNYAGIDAYKAVLFISAADGNVRRIEYLFHQGEATVFAYYTHIFGEYDEQDAIVDNSMKTFQFK